MLYSLGHRLPTGLEGGINLWACLLDTSRKRGGLVRAKHQVDRFGSLEIDPEHILLALLDDPVLIGQTMQGISEQEIIKTINAHFPRRERNPLPHDLDLSRAAPRGADLGRRRS
jgi:hypothetical protein